MRCEEAGPLLSDYRERALPEAGLQEIEQHLWQCEQCRADLSTLEALATQALAWPDMAVPEWHRTAFAVPQRPARQWLPWLSFATSTACVVLLLAGVDVERDETGFRMRLGAAAAPEQAALGGDALEQRLEQFQQQQQRILKYQLMAWDMTRAQDDRKLLDAMLEYTREQRERDLAQLAGYWQNLRDSDQAMQAQAFTELLTTQQQSRRELRALKASLQYPIDPEAP